MFVYTGCSQAIEGKNVSIFIHYFILNTFKIYGTL